MRNKWKAVRTVVDGKLFPSKGEARRYGELKMLQAGGKIRNLEVHPAYPIIINGVQVCIVELDFRYWCNERNCEVVEDYKGGNPMSNGALSRLKRRLVEAAYSIKVVIV